MNIFQTWKTKVNIDRKRLKYIDTVKIYNKSMKYHLYDDEDCDYFVKTKFPEYYIYYNKLKTPVQKADLWRYLIIYYYGGYYLDIDCKAVRKLPLLPENKNLLIVEYENPAPFKPLDGFPRNPQYAQYWFGATPRHPAIMKVIKRVIKNIKHGVKEKGNDLTLYLTGPVPWTDGINDYHKDNKDNKDIKIKPNHCDVISVGIDTQLVHNYKNTPVIHQAVGSWRSDDVEDNNLWIFVVLLIVIIFVVIFI